MPNTRLISALVTKRRLIAGEIQTKQSEIRDLMQDFDSLSGAIKAFDPKYRLESLKPIKPRVNHRPFKHGECSRLILEVMRDERYFLTTSQIMEQVAYRGGLNAQPKPKEVFNANHQKRIEGACVERDG